DDASGRYTTGFFYGNNYFTGSLSLCATIHRNDIHEDIFQKDEMRKSGLSHNNVYNPSSSSIPFENPPFLPGFFVLKMLVNATSVVPVPRTIYTGLCLPSTCTNSDVKMMGRFSQMSESNRQVTILAVRSPTQNPYNYGADRTFIILAVISTIVGVLLAAGTIYELVLTYQLKQRRKKKMTKELASDSSSGINCTTYDLTDAVPNKNDLPIGIVIPRSMNNNNSDENLAIESSVISESDDVKLNVWSELLLSFSIVTNFNAICDRRVGSDTIPSIHGLRAISMAWVILGHTCIIVFKYSDNMDLRKVVEKEFLFQTITNGAYSVDTFFFISGFLVSYIYFRTNAKGKLEKLSQGVNEITAGTYHFFGLIFYRFIRLTAPYMFVLGVVEVTMKYSEHHSVFDPPTLDHINCPQYWWRNVLYINTLFPVEDMCMLWSWYLSDDTQFYVIGAVILIIAVRHFKVASSLLLFFMLSSWATTGYIAFSNNHIPNSDDPLALFDKIYDKPWTRLGPYLIGMSVGWLLFKTNCKIRMRLPTVVAGWVTSSACLLYLIYGLYNTELSQLYAAAFSSLSHSAWAAALAWIVVACSTGYGGYINTLLSAPCIYPFSRVTYCAYLVHPIVIRLLALNSDAPLHLGSDSMVITFFGQVVASYILSFIVSLSFEAPVVTMLKILTPNRKKRLIS
ncbi:Nose resistant to fluoxetine protein 6, partial [Pseudolycoriella hygida]